MTELRGRPRAVPEIVFTMSYPERLGGAENFLWALLRHVDRARVRPTVVFLHDGPFVGEVERLGIHTRVMEAGRHRHVHKTVRVVARLARWLRQVRPDLIVNWTPEAQLYAGSAAALAGMRSRVVWWQHGMHGAQWLDPVATAIPALAVGASSEAGASEQRRHWPRRRTFVVHPGIDEESSAGPELKRADIGIPDGRLVVGSVGRLHPEKGHQHLLEALAVVRAAGLDAHGLVVGGTAHGMVPEYARSLHERAKQLGIDGAVTFTGQVPDASPYFGLMDVLVNPCPREGFGLVILEAMRAGVPVIAVAGGGPGEIIESGRSGLLVPPDDTEALATSLDDVLRDPELRTSLGDAGLRRFRAMFTSARMAEQMQDRLRSLAGFPEPQR